MCKIPSRTYSHSQPALAKCHKTRSAFMMRTNKSIVSTLQVSKYWSISSLSYRIFKVGNWSEQPEFQQRIISTSELTTYGALSWELAFLQSFAICFTLVDQSVKRIESCNDKTAQIGDKNFSRKHLTTLYGLISKSKKKKKSLENSLKKKTNRLKTLNEHRISFIQYEEHLQVFFRTQKCEWCFSLQYTNLDIHLLSWGNWHWCIKQVQQWQVLQVSPLFPI